MPHRSQVFTLQPGCGSWQRVHTGGRTPDPRDLHNAAALLWNNHIYVISARQYVVLVHMHSHILHTFALQNISLGHISLQHISLECIA